MKRLIAIFGGIIAAFVLVVVVFYNRREEPSTFQEICWEEVEDLKTRELEDGKYEVTLEAPDYIMIISYLADSGVEESVTLEMLADAVKDNPDANKRYSFVVESKEEEVIQEALMEKIAYELLKITLEESMG